MAGARNDPAAIGAGEEARMLFRHFGRADAVRLAVQRDRWHTDRRLSREALLDRLEIGITRGVLETVAVGLDGDIDEIRIVERDRGALERRVIEDPVRRPQPPDQAAEFAPVLLQPDPPAIGVKLIVVPEAALLL